MTCEEIQAIAMSLPRATHVRLWGRLDVYKVGGKVFASCGDEQGLSFKATEIAYEVLTTEGPGRPAPGFVPGYWVAVPLSKLEPEDAAGWIETSYGLAAAGLTKKARMNLGIG